MNYYCFILNWLKWNLQYPLSVVAVFVHFRNLHFLPPPWDLQKFVPPWADLVQTGKMQRYKTSLQSVPCIIDGIYLAATMCDAFLCCSLSALSTADNCVHNTIKDNLHNYFPLTITPSTSAVRNTKDWWCTCRRFFASFMLASWASTMTSMQAIIVN